jgi:hypothetical protein
MHVLDHVFAWAIWLFFRVLFSSKEKVMAIIFFYLIISFASAVFFAADRFLLPSGVSFQPWCHHEKFYS